MKNKNLIKMMVVVALLIWPVGYATSALPDKPIYEYVGDGEISFYNTHTDELVDSIFRDKKNHYLEDGIKEINNVLRCRLTNKVIPIDRKLIELIDYIGDHFNAEEIEVISGYRSPELNTALRAGGRGVAGRSYHLQGKAIDIRIPGVSTKNIRDFAASLKAGGVGYYPGPNFVHIDTGPVRYW